jgi:hypothetical protein
MLNGRGLVLDERARRLRSTRRRLNKWRTGKEGPWLIGEGMMRHSIMASSSVGRGEPVFDISWSEVSCPHVAWGSGLLKAVPGESDLAWRPGKTAA